MQEFGLDARVRFNDESVENGTGTVTEVVLYPDGDLHYYVVEFDDGRTFECSDWELERE